MNAVQYHPPPNQAGVALPPDANNPLAYRDIAHTIDYVSRLNFSRWNNPIGIAASDDEVGEAEAYEAGLTFAVAPPACAPAAAPPWVQGLYNFLDHHFEATRNYIEDRFEVVRGEQAILLANSQAGHAAPLYDPTRPGQWALLAAPNPTSRDNLMSFDYMQCIAAAAALGLPALPADADLPTRKRQIAGKIGVAMG